MKLVAWCPFARAEIDQRLGTVAGIEVLHVSSCAEIAQCIGSADGLLIPGSGDFYDGRVAKLLTGTAARLRWIQCLTAGHDRFSEHGIPQGVQLTSAAGSNALGVAEHGVAMLLALTRRMPLIFERQRQAEWDPGLARHVGSLEGKRVAVVGTGHVGQAFARLAKAFGMQAVGVNRSGKSLAPFDEIHSETALDAVLGDADVVVLAVPLSPDTYRLLDARRLTLMSANAYLVNIGRGGLVDCDALDAALARRAIAGAALDVTDPEPLPSTHPLWRNARALISPHLAGYGHPMSFQRLASVVEQNLIAILQGQPLTSVIDLSLERGGTAKLAQAAKPKGAR